MLKQADLAMYQAKAAGRNILRFFDPAMQTAVAARVALETDLRHGLQQREFMLHYQRQTDINRRTIGAEALVRWQHPQRGMVSPALFIPLAEESGLILRLGYCILETACRQLALWAANPETSHLTVAVNVSARQFRHPDFVDQMRVVLQNTGANPENLKLELTESLLVENVEDMIAKMFALKATGTRTEFECQWSKLDRKKQKTRMKTRFHAGFRTTLDHSESNFGGEGGNRLICP